MLGLSGRALLEVKPVHGRVLASTLEKPATVPVVSKEFREGAVAHCLQMWSMLGKV